MKKAILALALVMSIGATQVSLASSAPKHRYHPTTQQVDQKAAPASAAQPSASKDKDDEALEAYSDTTSTDSANYDDYDENDNRSVHSRYSLDNYDDPFDFIGSVFGGGALAVMIIFCIIFGLTDAIEEDQGSDASQEINIPPGKHGAQAGSQKGISQSPLHEIFIALLVYRPVAFRNIDALLHCHLRQLHPVVVSTHQITDDEKYDNQRSEDEQQAEDYTKDDDDRQRTATKHRQSYL